ncbi:MAG: T9SS type A sorting domain-containing protein, partial [Candidatus Hatepunaea meridiana]|nr:T9SS type A sorting domain-containing protein [Candidatus Hatepunaea meridiana]
RQLNFDISDNIGCGWRSGAQGGSIFSVIDFRNIHNPCILSADTSVRRNILGDNTLKIKDNYLYIVTKELNDNNPWHNYVYKLRVISLEDPSNPDEIGNYLFRYYNSMESFLIKDDYIYGFLSRDIVIMSIEDPEEPRLINQTEIEEIFSFGNTRIYGDYIYSLKRSTGVYVISIEERENPEYIGLYNDLFEGHWISYHRGIDVDDSYVYLTGDNGAIKIYSKNKNGTLSLCLMQEYIGEYSSVGSIVVSGDYGFINARDRVLIVNLGNRRSVELIGEVRVSGTLRLFGDYLTINSEEGFIIMSIEDPENPVVIGWYYNTPGYATDLAANIDSGIIVINDGFSIGIYDCSEALSIKEDPSSLLPHQTYLQAFPNPFNSTTTISYNLSSPALTSLSIYDLQGHRVAVLHNYDKSAGAHSITWDASGLPSGIYICKITSGNHASAIKLVVMR